ncbi:hypothetical protein Y032_0002g866 [Ancylostoma ceylanicum]|uniref:Uncharacterized protein n=1 Tax=Ancylostoma ceylanicum TaxID=53326 RepID=A0A016W3N3_9BILA|nr:hypothetical protein Y032_0002g866 [Ancylostoma ceylanicum]
MVSAKLLPPQVISHAYVDTQQLVRRIDVIEGFVEILFRMSGCQRVQLTILRRLIPGCRMEVRWEARNAGCLVLSGWHSTTCTTQTFAELMPPVIEGPTAKVGGVGVLFELLFGCCWAAITMLFTFL